MTAFLDELARRVLIFDGGMGTSVQAHDPSMEDFDHLEGCNEVLVRTRPDIVRDIHAEFLAVGCDVVETNTFGGSPWVLDEFGLGDDTEELNRTAADVARQACDQVPGHRFVAGSVGPGTRSPTLSLGNDPSSGDFIDYHTMVAGYTRQIRGPI
jgi:5-methyltetrahydrofolate--homocysteine methyltransferase